MTNDTKATIHIQDAVRLEAAACNVTLKPAGSLCNLDCSYCYYLGKAVLYGKREPVMSDEMLETVVRQQIQANGTDEVVFNWHGGEPLLLGKAFYEKALSYQSRYAEGKTIRNTLQTNGVLLTPEWAEFLAENGFLVGVSIDGPRDIHDKYRKDKGGCPTFERVIRGIGLLKEAGVEFNTLTTVNRKSEGRGLEVYEFLKQLGSRYIQFLPVVEHVKTDVSGGLEIVDPQQSGASIAPWSVGSIAYGRFLCDIFDLWVRNDVGTVFVNHFDATLASYCAVSPGSCVWSRTCGDNVTIEHNGDVYPCDHFVYEGRKLGNVCESSIRELMDTTERIGFGASKTASLPKKCRSCRHLFACNGECPKHRFSYTENGEKGLNVLCDGLTMYFNHVEPYMEYMKMLLSKKMSPALVIPWARQRKI